MKADSRLFVKYLVPVVTLVTATLVASSGVSAWSAYRATEMQLAALQSESARSAARQIELFIKDIEHQLGWTTLASIGPTDAVAQRRLDFLKLLRQVPAITEVAWIDRNGREQLRVSRLAMDAVGSNADFSHDSQFTAAAADRVFFSPVHFRGDTEPYMSISRRAGDGPESGVTTVEVNLKFVWEVVSRIRVGESGQAFVVNGDNLLIAHRDMSRVLQKVRVAGLPPAGEQATESGAPPLATDLDGRRVLSAQAAIPALSWRVFVESPVSEAYASIYQALWRAGLLLVAGLAISILASIMLARRMTRPIRMLEEGATRIGEGRLDQRIEVHTGDELESLGRQFNAMAANLSESYAGLERKVAERTAQLAGEQAKTQALLRNILPDNVVAELSATGAVKPVRHEEATVLFTDFAGFTQATAAMPPSRMVAELGEIFAAFDDISHEAGVEKIKSIGDAYLAAAGIGDGARDHATRCVRVALRMLAYVAERNAKEAFKWELRIGIHSGPVVSGVVGKRKYAFDIWGDTVNIASRIESAGAAGRVNVSAYTYDLVRNDFDASYRGKITAKGKGEIDMYFIEGPTRPK